MPRAKKGPAPAYNTGMPQPADAPTGMAYGDRKAALDAQSAVPLAGGAPTAAPSPAGGTAPPAEASPQSLLAAAQGYNFQPVGLVGPTERPGEPVTSGLATGPGAGPEALNPAPDAASQEIKTWAGYLPTLEFLASQPGSSQSTRNFVRRLRSTMPIA